jgi:hypothetical protein
MSRNKIYPLLDAVKLAIESSCLTLNASTNTNMTVEQESNIKSARQTIDIAGRRLREVLGMDLEDMKDDDTED